jgi:chemotaxis protein MotA
MTFVGVIVGFAAVLIGMIFKGVPYSALANPAAFFIIIVGTIGAVIIATPGNEIKNIGRLFGVLFGKAKFTTSKEVVTIMVDLAELVRRDGILALEERATTIEEPFIVQGIQMLTEGADTHQISEVLSAEIGAMEDRHAANAQIFTQAGTYAPTLGVLGAVLGLIAALSNMNDTEALGHAISAAFIATLLGIFTGYVLWHPFANRLKRKSKQEAFIKGLMLEGILGISEGQNPRMMKDRLALYLPEKARADFADEKEE